MDTREHLQALVRCIPAVSQPGSRSRFLGASCAMMKAYDAARDFLASGPEYRPIAEYEGCGAVLVSTASDNPKYLASDPVTAFRDVTGVWRCLGSVGGGAPLALQPTHFAPMPARPDLQLEI